VGRPVSRILLYPAIHLRERFSRAPLRGAAPTSPERKGPGTIWLARTGSLPGRPLAGYRRWALTPPFHPSPVPGRSEPSAGLLSVALDVTGSLRRPVPRVLNPSGLSEPEASDPRESGLFSTPRLCSGAQRRVGRPEPGAYYTDGSRPTRTIFVGLRRISTLPTRLQQPCQRGLFATAGSNQTPGLSSRPPLDSRTPS
jgi:hypothetical protein